MLSNPRSTARIVGIDIARFVALAGMMATHILPAIKPGGLEVTSVHMLTAGRASALFAVLAGVSLALVSGRSSPPRGRALLGAGAGVAVRAVLIAAVGLGLGMLDVRIAVILTYYGVLFLLSIPFLGLGPRWLFLLAATWVVLAPVLAQLVRREVPNAGSPTRRSRCWTIPCVSSRS